MSYLQRYGLYICLLSLLVASCTVQSAAAASPWQLLYRRSTAQQGTSIDLRAVGDIMFGRHIAEVGATRGFNRFLDTISPQGSTPLLGGDLTIANLESPLSEMLPLPEEHLRLIGPPEAAAALHNAGIQIVSLANNHSYDAGEAGLETSYQLLHQATITPIGIGRSAAQTRVAHIQQINGLTIAMLSASAVTGVHDPVRVPVHWQRATLDESFLQAVKDAASRADLVLVMVHWGHEYAASPASGQLEWAQRLIAAGADLIVGSHPHVLQPFEVINAGERSGLVLYSLGNLLFDQLTRWETSSGAVVRIILDQEGVVELAAAPVKLVGWSVQAVAPDTPLGRQILAAFGVAPSMPSSDTLHLSLKAWHWDEAQPDFLSVPAQTAPIQHPTRLYVDLRGDGHSQLVRLHQGQLLIYADDSEADPLVWESTALNWKVFRILTGDADNDGRHEVICLLIKADRTGALRVHPHMIGYRLGRYQIIWAGSPRPTEIRDIALADFDQDGRNELAYIEGGTTASAAGTLMRVYRWQSWFFYEEWHSDPGRFYSLDSRDLDGDGVAELLVETADPGLPHQRPGVIGRYQ